MIYSNGYTVVAHTITFHVQNVTRAHILFNELIKNVRSGVIFISETEGIDTIRVHNQTARFTEPGLL